MQPVSIVKSNVTDVANKEHVKLEISSERRNDLSFEDESERQRIDNGRTLLPDWFVFALSGSFTFHVSHTFCSYWCKF